MTGPTIAPDAAEIARLRTARERVLEQIASASARSGRDAEAITLVAVSKTVPAERIAAAVEAGYDVFGENRVQEAEAKVAGAPSAHWHLVGPLQSNKARRALGTFRTIESLDSLQLAERLDRLAGDVRPGERVPVLVQVNVDADMGKFGFLPSDLERELPAILELPRLDVRGLMTIGRLVERAEDARPTFAALRELAARLRALNPRLGAELSMGMSDDYPVAIEEGATIVRVGRALFGERHEH